MTDFTQEILHLYLVSRTDQWDYTEYSDFVVAAKNEEDARALVIDKIADTYYGRTAQAWAQAAIRSLGDASNDVERGIVLGSFHAG